MDSVIERNQAMAELNTIRSLLAQLAAITDGLEENMAEREVDGVDVEILRELRYKLQEVERECGRSN